MKIQFQVFGSATPLPPNIDLPIPPKTGERVEYINPNGNITFTISDTRYVIIRDEVYLLAILEEVRKDK